MRRSAIASEAIAAVLRPWFAVRGIDPGAGWPDRGGALWSQYGTLAGLVERFRGGESLPVLTDLGNRESGWCRRIRHCGSCGLADRAGSGWAPIPTRSWPTSSASLLNPAPCMTTGCAVRRVVLKQVIADAR